MKRRVKISKLLSCTLVRYSFKIFQFLFCAMFVSSHSGCDQYVMYIVGVADARTYVRTSYHRLRKRRLICGIRAKLTYAGLGAVHKLFLPCIASSRRWGGGGGSTGCTNCDAILQRDRGRSGRAVHCVLE